ncbi:uncharacterized protein LOC119658966 isoform X2 [Hermetia illucens]|uniref:uncharacterized protein LOC119658966 isoform X2 n=1 Tax=Hermetia illucens TaxID=343691 RepID=UPI0018CC53BE|nr:uncharacterized protein LOC119658966 isoform X2 [Hermetia illucens]
MKPFCIQIFLFLQVIWILRVAALQCYSCSSTKDASCVWRQSEGDKVTECEGSCINVILPDGSLFRGCLSDLPKSAFKQETCNSDSCNADVFPSNRLACYQCHGLGCANVTQITMDDSHLCRKFVEQDTCYTDVRSRADIRRGCSSDENYAPSPYQQQCRTSYCNHHAAVQTLTCWECDSSVSDMLACKLGKVEDGEMGKCQMTSLLGHPASCYVLHKAEYVRRGCSNDKIYNPNDEDITTCKTSLCNNKEISVTHCYECDSETDENCMFLDGREVSVTKCPAGTSSCFSCRDFGNIVRRGCGQPDQCIGACFPCWDDALCNSNPMYECYTCSAFNDLDCDVFTHPDLVDREICNKGCQVFLQNDTLHRGCLNETILCADDDTCSSCYHDNCNDYFIDSQCGVVKYMNSQEWVNSIERFDDFI